jgi:hypothetical protein
MSSRMRKGLVTDQRADSRLGSPGHLAHDAAGRESVNIGEGGPDQALLFRSLFALHGAFVPAVETKVGDVGQD